MNTNHENMPLDDPRFDQLVDGELSEAERRQLLAGLDSSPAAGDVAPWRSSNRNAGNRVSEFFGRVKNVVRTLRVRTLLPCIRVVRTGCTVWAPCRPWRPAS